MTIEIGLKDGDFVEIRLSDSQKAAAAKAIEGSAKATAKARAKAKAEAEKKAIADASPDMHPKFWHGLYEKEV